jgi:hypothetical protein
VTPDERIMQAEQRICQLWAAVLHLQDRCLPQQGQPVRTGSVNRVIVTNPVGGMPAMGVAVGLTHTASFVHSLALPSSPQIQVALSSRAVFSGTRGIAGLPEIDVGLTSSASMAGSGDAFAGIGSNDASFGTVPWTNPLNAVGPPDGSTADIVTVTGLPGQGLLGSDYLFAIPAGATIVGVQVTVTINDNSGNANTNTQVQLSLTGGLIGAAKAIAPTVPTILTPVVLGGPTDLWGASLAPADVNDPSFGAEVLPGINFSGTDIHVDSIEVQVYYTIP